MSVKSFNIKKDNDIHYMLDCTPELPHAKRLAINELARNVLDHGDGGQILINGVKIVAIQRGGSFENYVQVVNGDKETKRSGLAMLKLHWEIIVHKMVNNSILTVLKQK